MRALPLAQRAAKSEVQLHTRKSHCRIAARQTPEAVRRRYKYLFNQTTHLTLSPSKRSSGMVQHCLHPPAVARRAMSVATGTPRAWSTWRLCCPPAKGRKCSYWSINQATTTKRPVPPNCDLGRCGDSSEQRGALVRCIEPGKKQCVH